MEVVEDNSRLWRTSRLDRTWLQLNQLHPYVLQVSQFADGWRMEVCQVGGLENGLGRGLEEVKVVSWYLRPGSNTLGRIPKVHRAEDRFKRLVSVE